jgi:hypothetical protein
MIPTQAPEPFHRDGWVYEEKVDGWRILAYKDGQRVRLLSRRRGFGVAPTPWRAVQRAAWAAIGAEARR